MGADIHCQRAFGGSRPKVEVPVFRRPVVQIDNIGRPAIFATSEEAGSFDHWITSSACASTDSGILCLSDFAVFLWMISGFYFARSRRTMPRVIGDPGRFGLGPHAPVTSR